jgi:hypothetical protein
MHKTAVPGRRWQLSLGQKRFCVDRGVRALSCFRSLKLINVKNWWLPFLWSKSVYHFQWLVAHILNCYRWNQTIIHYSHPDYIPNIETSSSEYPIVPRRSYSRDKIPAHRPNPDTFGGQLSSVLWWKSKLCFLRRTATPCCLSWNLNIFDFFHIQGRQIFASNLSDFPWSIAAALTADFSFPCSSHSY